MLGDDALGLGQNASVSPLILQGDVPVEQWHLLIPQLSPPLLSFFSVFWAVLVITFTELLLVLLLYCNDLNCRLVFLLTVMSLKIGIFKKFLLNLLQYCFMFWLFGWKACGILASLIRFQTCTPCIGRQKLNHKNTRKVLKDRDFFQYVSVSLRKMLDKGDIWRYFNELSWEHGRAHPTQPCEHEINPHLSQAVWVSGSTPIKSLKKCFRFPNTLRLGW